jgi:hypothetical protein
VGSVNVEATHIELVWPGKDLSSALQADGTWQLVRGTGELPVRGLITAEQVGEPTTGVGSLLLGGDRLQLLRVLRHGLGRQVRLAYLDLPRLTLKDTTREFKTHSYRHWSVWLSVCREHFRSVRPLLARDGAVVVHTGEQESAHIRLVLDEVFGHHNRIGTIIWQRSFSPKGDLKEIAAGHDVLFVYANDLDALPRVALTRSPQGYSNDDNDPRGDWRVVRQKGSATYWATCDFTCNHPPYRWELANGRLPPGIWRISPMTGVIWGTPSKAGRYRFRVRVTDQSGACAEKQFSIKVTEKGKSVFPDAVPWLFNASPNGDAGNRRRWTGLIREGSLKFATESLPDAVIGAEYSTVLMARGGTPYRGTSRPGTGRYWEFSWSTLLEYILKDRADFGTDGTALPRPRRYSQEEGDVEYAQQQSLWWGSVIKASDHSSGEDEGVGFTRDATQHLKRLLDAGIIEEVVKSAKPELLLSRVVQLFSRPDDLVLEVFGESADLSSVALKLGRRFAYLVGDSTAEHTSVMRCGLPRLRGIAEGREHALPPLEQKRVQALPSPAKGHFVRMELGPVLGSWSEGQDYPALDGRALRGSRVKLAHELLAAEGYLRVREGLPEAESYDGRRVALLLPPSDFLTAQVVAEFASSNADRYEQIAIYFFRQDPGLRIGAVGREGELNPTLSNVILKRIPMDLAR